MATKTASRREVLWEITRLVVEGGLPAPEVVRVYDTQLYLDWDRAEDLDAWAAHLGMTPKACVHPPEGTPSTWHYTADRYQQEWLGRTVHLKVIHWIPTGDDLVGGES